MKYTLHFTEMMDAGSFYQPVTGKSWRFSYCAGKSQETGKGGQLKMWKTLFGKLYQGCGKATLCGMTLGTLGSKSPRVCE